MRVLTISDEKAKRIARRWRDQEENQIWRIAKQEGVSQHIADKVVNMYIAKKISL